MTVLNQTSVIKKLDPRSKQCGDDGAVAKDGTVITLLGLTADTEITEVHHPLGVAAGHLRSLRERGMEAEIASVESGTSV